MKESELFKPLKKYFNELGYKVYAEVPNHYRCIDFVAVKGEEQIAVEMKTSFNIQVIRQASGNKRCFHKSYIAVPAKDPKKFVERYRNHKLMGYVLRYQLGLFLVFGKGAVVEFIEGSSEKPHELYDFGTFEELDTDEAGIPFQKGKSTAFVALDRIKKYVAEHPAADWKEIYNNVQTHYSSYQSLAGSMSQWKGFSLAEYKKTLTITEQKVDELPLFGGKVQTG